MNIPNILTIIRLILVPVFLLIFFSNIPNAMLISFIVFAAAGLTDILDGYIARKFNLITKWGSILDPLADKLMSIAVLISLTVKHIIPFWVVTIIGLKEFFMILGAIILYKMGTFVSAKLYGKIATVLFYISVIFLEIDRTTGLLLLYLTVAAALFALGKYVENYKNVKHSKL
ncbi:MAG: CDP-alcohol phosphatidyltransferase family protein [Clostridiales bacterium]|nr:CDP-alcohol phosphatidyltransferase family protein [Clostridiales bacterium]HBM81594.1 CDP-diacylglycerol--glycerol-3-phosphate 3-phosphatidyltransferase [Clostridiaceae bacterium]